MWHDPPFSFKGPKTSTFETTTPNYGDFEKRSVCSCERRGWRPTGTLLVKPLWSSRVFPGSWNMFDFAAWCSPPCLHLCRVATSSVVSAVAGNHGCVDDHAQDVDPSRHWWRRGRHYRKKALRGSAHRPPEPRGTMAQEPCARIDGCVRWAHFPPAFDRRHERFTRKDTGMAQLVGGGCSFFLFIPPLRWEGPRTPMIPTGRILNHLEWQCLNSYNKCRRCWRAKMTSNVNGCDCDESLTAREPRKLLEAYQALTKHEDFA